MTQVTSSTPLLFTPLLAQSTQGILPLQGLWLDPVGWGWVRAPRRIWGSVKARSGAGGQGQSPTSVHPCRLSQTQTAKASAQEVPWQRSPPPHPSWRPRPSRPHHQAGMEGKAGCGAGRPCFPTRPGCRPLGGDADSCSCEARGRGSRVGDITAHVGCHAEPPAPCCHAHTSLPDAQGLCQAAGQKYGAPHLLTSLRPRASLHRDTAPGLACPASPRAPPLPSSAAAFRPRPAASSGPVTRWGPSASDGRLDPGQGLACEQGPRPHPRPAAAARRKPNASEPGRGSFPEIRPRRLPAPSFPRPPIGACAGC